MTAPTISVWPKLGTTVTLASGYVITSAGAAALLTDEIRNLLDAGRLCSSDPTHLNPNPSPIPPSNTGGVTTASTPALSLLFGAAGTVATATGRLSAGDGGGGTFRWDASSTATIDNNVCCGDAAVTGRWLRIIDGAVNVKWFGATGDGTTNDFQAIRAAFDYARNSTIHKAVYFPTGRYRKPHEFPYYYTPGSGVAVFGDGASSVLVMDNSESCFDCTFTDAVSIKDLRLEFNTVLNFLLGINANDSTNLKVDNCEFWVTAPDVQFPPPLGSAGGLPIRTLHSMVSSRSSGVQYTNNRHYRMQCKAGSDTGGQKCIITGNRWDEPYDFAVSYVSGNNVSSEISSLVLSNNYVHNPRSSGAFHVGADGEVDPLAVMSDILIEGNVVDGSYLSGVAGLALTINMGYSTKNIKILNNTFRNDGPWSNNSGVMRLFASDTALGTSPVFEDIQIAGNTLSGADQFAISFYGSGSGLKITGNACPGDSRGIQVLARPGGLDGMQVSDNIMDGCLLQGIIVNASEGNITNLIVSRNLCNNSVGDFSETFGIKLINVAGTTIEALVEGNICRNPRGNTGFPDYGQWHGIRQTGLGAWQVKYVDNDCRGNLTTDMHIVNGSAIGFGNRGLGFPAAAPTVGTWAKGDRVQNHNPTVGQPKAWVCTAGGTPGTWVSEGNL